jgi:hypothetical protein
LAKNSREGVKDRTAMGRSHATVARLFGVS